MTRAQAEIGSEQDESMVAGLFDTDTWVMGSINNELNVKSSSVLAVQHLDMAADDPRRRLHRPPSLNCGEHINDCFCCVAKGMFLASDDAVVSRRRRFSAGLSPAVSPTASINSTLEESVEDTSALMYLARYISMSDEALHALQRSRATLGTLAQLTVDDLCRLGVTIPMDAISLLRAANALGTLRQFKAVGDAKQERKRAGGSSKRFWRQALVSKSNLSSSV